MSKTKLTLLTALLVLMVVSLTVLVPSGAVTDEALSRYEDALWEQEEDEEESAREVLKPRAVLANAALSDVPPPISRRWIAAFSPPEARPWKPISPKTATVMIPLLLKWKKSGCTTATFLLPTCVLQRRLRFVLLWRAVN